MGNEVTCDTCCTTARAAMAWPAPMRALGRFDNLDILLCLLLQLYVNPMERYLHPEEQLTFYDAILRGRQKGHIVLVRHRPLVFACTIVQHTLYRRAIAGAGRECAHMCLAVQFQKHGVKLCLVVCTAWRLCAAGVQRA